VSKRNAPWLFVTATLVSGACAATAAAQAPAQPAPPPGPAVPATTASGGEAALPPAPPPPTATQPPPQQPPPSYPPPQYPPGYPPGYYPGYYPGYPPGYGYPAYGQPAYGPPPPYAYGYPMPPPYVPPPPQERGVHLHDGFYMRLAIGGGAIHTTIHPEGSGDDAKLSGGGLALDFGFGGAVADGFIIGGRMQIAEASDPDVEIAGDKGGTNGSLDMGGLQFFADIYPWPRGGFHVLAGFGPGFLSYDPTPGNSTYREENDASSASGYSATVGVGWEGWVSSQWGIGGMLNLNWGRFSDTVDIRTYDAAGNSTTLYDSKSTLTAFAPNITFTATFN